MSKEQEIIVKKWNDGSYYAGIEFPRKNAPALFFILGNGKTAEEAREIASRRFDHERILAN